MGHMWYLIVSIPNLYTHTYFAVCPGARSRVSSTEVITNATIPSHESRFSVAAEQTETFIGFRYNQQRTCSFKLKTIRL